MERFKGLSGKFYIENSFGQGKYDYAVYESEDLFKKSKGYLRHVDAQTAFDDFKEIKSKEGYVFFVDINGEDYEIETNVLGEMHLPIDGQLKIKNYLQKMQGKYGRENVTYTFQKTIK